MVSVIDPVFPDDFPELVSVGTNTKLLAHNLGVDGHVSFTTLANSVLAEIPTSGSLTLGGSLSVAGDVTTGGNATFGVGPSGTNNGVLVGNFSGLSGIQAVSTSANASLRLFSKGDDGYVIALTSTGVKLFSAARAGVTSPVNNLLFVPSSAGTGPQILTEGTDTNRDIRLTPAGTGVVKTQSIYLGNQTTFVASGTQAANQYAWLANFNISGSLSANQSFSGTKIVVNSDALKMGSPAPRGTHWMEVVGNLAAGFAGCRDGISSTVSITGTQDTSIGVDDNWCHWVGVLSTIQINSNQGGSAPTSGASRGIIYGGGDQVWALSGATNLSNVIGREIDVRIQSGASAAQRIGLLIVSYSGVQGNNSDSAIQISALNAASMVGWQRGITFGSGAVDPTGEIIGYKPSYPGSLTPLGLIEPAPIVARGINFQPYKFTDATMVLPGGTRIEPNGDISVGPASFKTTTSAATINTGGYKLSSVGSVTAGAAFVANDQVWSSDGTILTINAVNGSGTPTSFTIEQRGGVIGSPPSNPVTFYGGTGSGLSVNLNWTQITTLNLQTGGGETLIGGTLTLNSAVYITSLPTSPSGLTAGRLWNNGGVVCVV